MPANLEAEYGASLDRWTTGVPTIQQVIASASNPGALGARSAFATVDLGKLATAYTWVSESKRTGAAAVSAQALDAFDGLAAVLQDNPKADTAWQQIAGGLGECLGNPDGCAGVVIDGVLSNASSLMQQAATSVPVLGWVVGFAQLALSVGTVIWQENQDAKPTPELALEADPFTDQAVGNELLDFMRKDDWTELFLPTHDGSDGYYVREVQVEYGSGYKGGRFELASAQGQISGTGFGLVPGGGVARVWQYRGKQASTGSTAADRLARALNLPIAAGEGFEAFTTYGEEYYTPAYEQIGQLAWSMVGKPGPAMFRVDVAKLRPAWENYWSAWLLAFYQMRMAGNPDAARLVPLHWGGSFPDWPSWQTLAGYITGPDAHEKGAAAIASVPEKYRDLAGYNLVTTGKTLVLPGGVVVEERQPAIGGQGSPNSWWVTRRGMTLRYLDNLEDAQREALHRIDVAYMTGNEPGLGGPGAPLWELWDDNRRLLLNHPALFSSSFDASRVPKVDYTGTGVWRQAAFDKRRTGVQVALAQASPAEVLKPNFLWGVGAPRTRIEPSKKGEAAKRATFAKPDDLGKTGGGGGGLLVGLGLLGLAVASTRRG